MLPSGLAILVVLLAGPSSASAPEVPADIAVFGRVIDARSGAPVAGARVAAAQSTATTAPDGRFALMLPPGGGLVEVTADGYLAATVRVAPAAGTPAPTLTLSLTPRARFQDQVEVTASPDALVRSVGELPVRPGDVAAVAGAGENVFRTLQTLPGVSATDEFGSRLAVRAR
jgi:hypothetical protein